MSSTARLIPAGLLEVRDGSLGIRGMSFTRENRPRTRLVRLDSARWGLAKLSGKLLSGSSRFGRLIPWSGAPVPGHP